MAYKYLDKTGLAYFWTKIKAYVTSLVSSKADDSNVVHKTGVETVSGLKTFSNRLDISYEAINALRFRDTRKSAGVPLQSNIYQGISWYDNDSEAAVSIYKRYNAETDSYSLCFNAYAPDNGDGDDKNTQLAITYPSASNLTTPNFYIGPEVKLSNVKVRRTADNSRMLLCGGSDSDFGGTLSIYGKDHSSYPGWVSIHAKDGTNDRRLLCKSSGYLTWTGYQYQLLCEHIEKNVTPQTTQYSGYTIRDKNDDVIGAFQFAYRPDGSSDVKIGVFPTDEPSTDFGAIYVGSDSNGNYYGKAPSTSTLRDAGTDIVTRNWIPKDIRIVHTTGNETISGVKTFNSKIEINTPNLDAVHFNYSDLLIVPSTFPAGTVYRGYSVRDGAGRTLVECYHRINTNGHAKVWQMHNLLAADATAQFAFTYNNSTDKFYLSGPAQFDADDDSSKIPNTAWIRNATGNFACNAATATKLKTARTINGVSFDGSANITVEDSTKLPLSGGTMTGNITWSKTATISGESKTHIAQLTMNASSLNFGLYDYTNNHWILLSNYDRSFTVLYGDITGNAATATKLATARTIRTNLASTDAVSFDGSTDVVPGVTGTLPVANGGTGATTLDDAGIVTKTGDQTVGGQKTFSSSPIITRINPYLTFRETDWAKGDTTGSTSYQGIYFRDKNSETGASVLYHYYPSSQASVLEFTTYDMTSPSATASSKVVFSYRSSDIGFLPDVSDTVLLGRSDKRWKEVWCNQSSINSSSDERMKRSVAPMPDEVLDAWGDVNWVQYQWADSVEEKGDGARLHSGLVAQDVDRRFRARGLDVSRYGLFLYDKWAAVPEERDPEGNLVAPARGAGDAYGLRYVEALCMEAAYLRRENARLKERVASLEERLAALELRVA